MRAGHRNACECIAAFSATDFRHDLAVFDVPTLVIPSGQTQLHWNFAGRYGVDAPHT